MSSMGDSSPGREPTLVAEPDAAPSGEKSDSAADEAGASGSHALPKGDTDENGDPVQYPSSARAFLIIFALFLAVFVYALDQTVIATAIPTISREFNSAADIGWYGSAYLLTSCTFQLAFGQFYRLFRLKIVYLSAFLVFELGSLICGVAPNSAAFTVGRAIAGLGCAGIFSGSFLILQHTVPLQKRAGFAGVFGAAFALASITGPLVGGAFTANVTWRWCFYINLPIGAVVIGIALLVFHEQPAPLAANDKESFFARVKKIDWLGLITFLPSIVCLLLALQWGAAGAWSDGRVIATLTVFAVLLVAFVGTQYWMGEGAMVPFHILKKHRSIGCGALYTFCLSAAFLIITYYLPEWYQLVLGVSPIQSGINTLPVIIGFAVAALMAGAAVGGIGYYVPPMLLGSIFAAIGAGLMSTFTPSSNSSHWIGYTALFGLGIGAGIQQPEVAVQALLDRTEVPVGFALMAFAQSMGGAVFVSVAQNIFGQKIASGDLGGQAGHASDSSPLSTNVAGLLNSVPADQKQKILDTYNGALTYTFLVAAIMAALSFIFALCMEWKSVKTEKKPKKGDEGTSRDEEEKTE